MSKYSFRLRVFLIVSLFFLAVRPIQAQSTPQFKSYIILHSSLAQQQKHLTTRLATEEYIRNFAANNGCKIPYYGRTFTHLTCGKALPTLSYVFPDQYDRPLTGTEADNYKNIQTQVQRVHKEFGMTGTSAVVAILDSGVESNHPELSDQIIGGRNFIMMEDPAMAENFVDDMRHGTQVAGVVAATGKNLEAQGVAPSAQIWVGKVCYKGENDEVLCPLSAILAALEYIRLNKPANVVNISLGGMGTSGPDCDNLYDPVHQEYMRLVNSLVDQGIMVVAAAGNNTGNEIMRPACASKAIAVGATNRYEQISSFSNHGEALDLVAPGDEIFTTYPAPHNYLYASGTSLSSPVVAGIVGMMRSLNDFTPDQIKQHLYDTAKNLNANPTEQGHGLVDAYQAINSLCMQTPCYHHQTLGWDFTKSIKPVSGFAVTQSLGAKLKTDKDGTSLFFNGRNARLKITHNPFFNFSNWNFTIQTTIKLKPSFKSKSQTIFSKFDRKKNGYQLQITPDKKLLYSLTDQTGRTVILETNPLLTKPKQWYSIQILHTGAPSASTPNVTITFDGRTQTLKVLEPSSQTPLMPMQLADPFYIGGKKEIGDLLKGWMRDFSITTNMQFFR